MIGRLLRVLRTFCLYACILLLLCLNSTVQAQQTFEWKADIAENSYPRKLDSTVIYANGLLQEIRENGRVTPFEEQMLDLLGRTYRRLGETQKSEAFFLESIALSEKRHNIAQLGDSYNRLGLLYRGVGRIDEALESYERSIDYKTKAGNEGSVASTYNNLGNLYRAIGEREKAYEAFIHSIEIRERIGDHKNAATTYLNLGNWLTDDNNFTLAREYFNQYKRIQEDIADTSAIVLVLGNIGSLFIEQAQYDSALVYLLESVELIEQSNLLDPRRGARIFMGIGNVYDQLEYQFQAIDNYQKALRTYIQFQEPENMSIAYQNIGKVYSDLGQADSSLKYYELSLEEARVLGNPEREAILLNNLGVLHNQNGNYELALNFSQRSAEIYNELGDYQHLAEVNYNLGASWFYLGQFNQAINRYNASLLQANEAQDLEMQERIAHALAETFGEIRDFKNAFKYQLMYNTYKDSLMDLNRVKVIEELITKYETEKKEAEIQLLTAEQAQNKAQLAQQNAENKLLYLGIITLIAATLGVIGWFVYSSRKKRVIQLQKDELHMNEVQSLIEKQSLESISAMLEGQEKERRRLAAELHDRLGSILSLVKMYFSSMNDDLKESEPELYASFQEGNQFLDDAFLEVRALIREMKEGKVSGKGLEQDVKELLEKIRKIGVEIDSNISLEQPLDTLLEVNIYRVIQEALSNSLKYSSADLIRLELVASQSLTLIIADNGEGFDHQKYTQSRKTNESYGVENMENRIKVLGGSFELKTSPGNGVIISVEVPLVDDELQNSIENEG